MAELVQHWASAERAHSTEPPVSPPWPLRQPASLTDLRGLEDRLGVALPPSYREFLSVSDGSMGVQSSAFETGVWEYGLFCASDVGWFGVLQPDDVEIWMHSSEPEYADHEPVPHSSWKACELGFCNQCLPGTLLIGEADEWLLLNPGVTDSHGEWECWHFAGWNPGAIRYRSFRAYLEVRMMTLAPEAIGSADRFTIAAGVARDDAAPQHERIEALGFIVHDPRAVELLDTYLALVAPTSSYWLRRSMIDLLADLLGGGVRSARIVSALAPVCMPPRPTDSGGRDLFDRAVRALALSDHPTAVNALRAVLRDVGSAHVYSVQEGFRAPDMSLYREEFLALWEETGDPAYLLNIAYQGDESVIETIRDFVDNPREYRLAAGAHPQAREITMRRIEYAIEVRDHPFA